jgi:dynein heavy chain
MQSELTALRPQLLATSDETERLMIKIEQDTIQVEAKKEIVACDEALANEAAAAAQAIRKVERKMFFPTTFPDLISNNFPEEN